jgi:hypothetical protein
LKNEWLFSYKTIKGFNYRLYDNRVIDIKYTFLSEYKIFLEKMLSLNFKIYFIETLPKHNNILSEKDFEFFQKYAWNDEFNKNINIKTKGYEIPKKIKILREYQSLDLLPFYDDLIAESFFVISKMCGNLYHFNLVVCVKSEFKLLKYLKNDFKLIKVVSAVNIQSSDLTYNWMNFVFNFNCLEKFKNTQIDDSNFYQYNFKFHNIDSFEKINFESYKDYCISKKIDFSNNPMFDWYKYENVGKISEMQNQYFILKNQLKTFGWVWFCLDYYFTDERISNWKNGGSLYTYPMNESYFYIPHESEIRPTAIVTAKGEQLHTEDYLPSCMLDMIDNINMWGSPFKFNFINIQLKKYNTICKQRL